MELWALPLDDHLISEIIAKYTEQLVQPNSLKNFVTNNMQSEKQNVAVFLPGGQTCMRYNLRQLEKVFGQ